jgi:hypothetical protein
MLRRRFKQTVSPEERLPKKRSACEWKPSCFHLALNERRYCAEPAKPKPAYV